MVIYIALEGMQIPFENGNPQYKRDKQPPDFLGSTTTKIITVIDAKLTVKVNDLLDLPKGVHRNLMVSGCHI
jgi:hypothetical protein